MDHGCSLNKNYILSSARPYISHSTLPSLLPFDFPIRLSIRLWPRAGSPKKSRMGICLWLPFDFLAPHSTCTSNGNCLLRCWSNQSCSFWNQVQLVVHFTKERLKHLLRIKLLAVKIRPPCLLGKGRVRSHLNLSYLSLFKFKTQISFILIVTCFNFRNFKT